MENAEPYKYIKLDKLPRHLCYSCKKGDVDSILTEREIEPPFHELWMTMGPFGFKSELQQHHKEPELIVASASSRYHGRTNELWTHREVTRAIYVYSIPIEFSKAVRSQLMTAGLPKLMQWLDSCIGKHETWQQQTHQVQLVFNKANTTLAFQR